MDAIHDKDIMSQYFKGVKLLKIFFQLGHSITIFYCLWVKKCEVNTKSECYKVKIGFLKIKHIT